MLIAIDICGGKEALQPGSRLILAKLGQVCDYLIRQGVSDPLLSVSIRRRGRSLTIVLDGQIVDPLSGQILLEKASEEVGNHFNHELVRIPWIANAVEAEIKRYRQIKNLRDG